MLNPIKKPTWMHAHKAFNHVGLRCDRHFTGDVPFTGSSDKAAIYFGSM